MNSRVCLRFYATLSKSKNILNVAVAENLSFLVKHPFYSNPNLVRGLSSKAKKEDESDKLKVYAGPLSRQILLVKVSFQVRLKRAKIVFILQAFSISSSIFGILSQPILYSKIVSTGSIPLILGVYSFFGFFTVGTPLLLHTFTKKYVVDLIHKPKTDTYVATTYTIFTRAIQVLAKVI